MTQTATSQKQEPPRIRLSEQIPATVNGRRAAVLEISLSGVLLAHQVHLSIGEKVLLHFDWKGDPIEFRSEVSRTESEGPAPKPGAKAVFRSDLRFISESDPSRKNLRNLMTDLISRALDEQKANARGVPAMAASSFQSGRKGTRFLTFRYVRGGWSRATTANPTQPMDGFTVASCEEPAQIELLCQAYAAADYDGRKLIRNLAALTLTSEQGVPTRRYDP